jgi:DNA polymerase (family 10)
MGGKLVSGKKLSANQAHKIISNVKNIIGSKGVYIAGSLRRGKSEVGDLDLVVVREEAESNLNERLKTLTGTDLSKRKSCSFVYENVQIDLNICNSDIKGSYILHWTGSTKENVRLRKAAKKIGCKLSQNGLFNNNNENLSKNKSEQEIYELLGMKYVKPQDR